MGRGSNIINEIGNRHGSLVVIERGPRLKQAQQVAWLCQCDCGGIRNVLGVDLRSGVVTKCHNCTRQMIRHGLTAGYKLPPQYYLWKHAKRRAARGGLPFNIKPSDVAIPSHCPCLGIPLIPGLGKRTHDGSPSIDRIIPELGYVSGNIRVISYKANAMKRNGTAEELRRIADYIDAALVNGVEVEVCLGL